MKHLLTFAFSILLTTTQALSAQNPLAGTNVLFTEGRGWAYELSLEDNGTGRLVNSNGASEIDWAATSGKSITSIYLKTDTVAFVTYTNAMLDGVYQMIEQREVLKSVTIYTSPALKVVEVWEQTRPDFPGEVTDDVRTIEGVKITNNFTNPFVVKAGDELALPVLNTENFGSWVVTLKLTDASSGIVTSKNGSGVADTFNWSLANGSNQLKISFNDGRTLTYSMVDDGQLSKVIAREVSNDKTQLISYQPAAKVEATAKIDAASFAGSYKTSLGLDEDIVYEFLIDGTGGFESPWTDENGVTEITYEPWVWRVDVASNSVVADRYHFNAEFDIMTKEDALACASSKVDCTLFNSRTLKILSTSGNQLVILRVMSGADMVPKISDIFVYEKL